MGRPETIEEMPAWASFYLSEGLSFIPIKERSKAPNLATWAPYQGRPPTDDEIGRWLGHGLLKNIGIVCGFNALVVLDIEDRRGYETLFTPEERDNFNERTWVVRSGRGGCHLYFFDVSMPKTLRLHTGPVQFDLQSLGAYVLAPPSVTSARYEFLSQPGNHVARFRIGALLSQRLRELGLGVDSVERRKWRDVENTAEGSRDDSLFRYGCHLRNCVGKSPEIILHEMRRANSSFKPPLSDTEVRKCWRNAMSYGGRDLGEKEIT